MSCDLSKISKVVFWKYEPKRRKRSKPIVTRRLSTITSILDAYDKGKKSRFYEEDYESTRYFFRLLGKNGSVETGAALTDYTCFGNDWLYTPDSSVWNALSEAAARRRRK